MVSSHRVQYIDFVKCVAIIAVTIGHVIGSYTFGNWKLSFYVYSFELPAFFLVSGWLQQMKKIEVSIKEYVIKSLKSVFYPYATFSILYIFFSV